MVRHGSSRRTELTTENDKSCSSIRVIFAGPARRSSGGPDLRTYDIFHSRGSASGLQGTSLPFVFVNAHFWYPRTTEGSSSEKQLVFYLSFDEESGIFGVLVERPITYQIVQAALAGCHFEYVQSSQPRQSAIHCFI